MNGTMANRSRAANRRELAEPQYDGAFPLIGYHDRLRGQEPDNRQAAGDPVVGARACVVGVPSAKSRGGQHHDSQHDRRPVSTVCL